MFEHTLRMFIDIWGFWHQNQSWSLEKVEENNGPSEFLINCLDKRAKIPNCSRPIQSFEAQTGLLDEILRTQCFYQIFSSLIFGIVVKALECQMAHVKRVYRFQMLFFCITNFRLIFLKINKGKDLEEGKKHI